MAALTTEFFRIALRPLKKSDAGAFLYCIKKSRKELHRFLPWEEGIHTEQDASQHIAPYILQDNLGIGGLWGIFLKDKSETLIGAVYLHWVSDTHKSSSIGYWISSEYTGKGLATEALHVFCKYLFNECGLNRIEVHTAIENLKSIALLKRVGFISEGVCREYEFLHGKFLDHYRFSLLKSDKMPIAEGAPT